MLVDWPVWSVSLVWSIWLVWLIGLVWLLTGWTIALSVGMLVSLRLSWLIGDLAADSSIRVFAGCWFGHDRSRSFEDLAAYSSLRIFVGCWFGHDDSKSYGILRLAKASRFLLAAWCGTIFLANGGSRNWWYHEKIWWSLVISRSPWPTEGSFCRWNSKYQQFFKFCVRFWFFGKKCHLVRNSCGAFPWPEPDETVQNSEPTNKEYTAIWF